MAASCLILGTAAAEPSRVQAPKHGHLKVVGASLRGQAGQAVQLRGMSTMGLQWYGGIVNAEAFRALALDWKADVVRLAYYVGEGGAAANPALKGLLEKGIDLAIENGLYVIVDWHVLTPGNPNHPVYSGAEAFFADIATRYGTYPHLVYEIMNEPNGAVSWARDLKPYAERMVKAIRAKDPDNLIIIGSGTWSQEVDIAAEDPVKGANLAYAVHFYAGSHGFVLRYKVQAALERGVAVFCSEWGTSEASGTGGPFLDKAEEWLDFFDEKGISWVNWSLCNKKESSAALKPSTRLEPAAKGPGGLKAWKASELSPSGAYVRAKLRGEDPLKGGKP